MEDNRIIELYFSRDERAIEATKESYGRLIYSVAKDIVGSDSESEECENDTYLRLWESIPPARPARFTSYLCKITRNLALNRVRNRGKRLEAQLIYEELSEVIPATEGDISEDIALRDALNDFLGGLGKTKRQIFTKRYFFMRSLRDISRELGISEGSIKVALLRIRHELREFLEERDLYI